MKEKANIVPEKKRHNFFRHVGVQGVAHTFLVGLSLLDTEAIAVECICKDVCVSVFPLVHEDLSFKIYNLTLLRVFLLHVDRSKTLFKMVKIALSNLPIYNHLHM